MIESSGNGNLGSQSGRAEVHSPTVVVSVGPSISRLF